MYQPASAPVKGEKLSKSQTLKIFSAENTRALDKITIERHWSSSWELMEHASYQLFTELVSLGLVENGNSFIILCGPGNNGGDGLAIARMLTQRGCQVRAYLQKSKNYSADNLMNQVLLQKTDTPIHTFQPSDKLAFQRNTVIIDALFGTGLHKPLSSDWQGLFDKVLISSPKKILAVDMPSGLMSDTPMPPHAVCLPADIVFTFQYPKLALLLPGNKKYCRSFRTLDIGLDGEALSATAPAAELVDAAFIRRILRHPDRYAHKGTFGHVLVAGGRYGSMGAPVLSARAALRAGCGLATLYIPRCGYTMVQTALPEAMCMSDEKERTISSIPAPAAYDAIAIGMGAGTAAETADALLVWLRTAPAHKIVLDADALNILSRQQEPFQLIPEGSVLTPHPKELERLIGTWENDFEKLETVRRIALEHRINIVIKGAHSAIISMSGELYFNSSGNWGMATAGSGDTLSGIIASLIAQGYPSDQACITGVYLHGSAGDIAARDAHPHSVIASDIIDSIGLAYRALD